MKSLVIYSVCVCMIAAQKKGVSGSFETDGESTVHIEPSQVDWSEWEDKEFVFRKATPFHPGVCFSTVTTTTTLSESDCTKDIKFGWNVNTNTCWATTTQTLDNGGWGTPSPVTTTRTKTTITGIYLSPSTVTRTSTSTTVLTSTTVDTVSTTTSTSTSTSTVTNPESTVVSTYIPPGPTITEDCSVLYDATSYTLPFVLESTETCVTSTVTTTVTPSTSLVYLVTTTVPTAVEVTTCTYTATFVLNDGTPATTYVAGSPVTSTIDTTTTMVFVQSTVYVDVGGGSAETSTGPTTVPSSTCFVTNPDVYKNINVAGVTTCTPVTTTVSEIGTVSVLTSTDQTVSVTSTYIYAPIYQTPVTNTDVLIAATSTLSSTFTSTVINPVAVTPTLTFPTTITYPATNSIGTLTEFPPCPQCTITVTSTELGPLSTAYVFGTTTLGVTTTILANAVTTLYTQYTTTSTITPTIYTTETVTEFGCLADIATIITTTTTWDETVKTLATATTFTDQVTSTVTSTHYPLLESFTQSTYSNFFIAYTNVVDTGVVTTAYATEVSVSMYSVNPEIVSVFPTHVLVSGTVSSACNFDLGYEYEQGYRESIGYE